MACVYAHANVSCYNEGADVQGSALGVGDPVLLNLNQSLDCLNKVLNRNGRDAHTLGRVNHALTVAVGAEKLNLVVSSAVGLQSLEQLLCVVENNAGGVQLEGRIGDDAGIVPALLGIIVHDEHMVGGNLTEAHLGGVNRLGLGRIGQSDFDIQHLNALLI